MEYLSIIIVFGIIGGVICAILQMRHEKLLEIEKQQKLEIAKKEEEHRKQRLQKEAEERKRRNTQISKPKQIKEFSFSEAVDVYLKTDHKTCQSIYDYKSYFKDAFYCILQGLNEYEIKLCDEKVYRNKEIDNPIEETKNITKATNLEKIKDFITIDTETTGLKCGGNDIIEICAIKFLNFRPAEKFHTYLKPRKNIPDSATEINGITDDMVCNSPSFSQIKSSLQDFIGDLPLVAHNAPFDMKFLHVSGLNLENHSDKVYDTLKLSKLKLRDYDGSKFESYKLSALCDELNISCNTFHSADSDTLACGLLFIDILKTIKDVESVDDF